jgi:mono/diheme cytochrome c family protein
MRKILRVTGIILLVIILLVAGLLTYVKTALPNVGAAPSLTVEPTPQRIQRGDYLANYVTLCTECHSVHDTGKFSRPLIEGTLGKGGERFDQRVGFPGVYYAKNITPAGIGQYTDGELYRVITTGVSRTGQALFPVMPYHYYGQMDPEDIKSIIAYIRTLPSIPGETPASVSDFPMNFILNTIPQKAQPHAIPSASNSLAYGAYMITACGCVECHTPARKGQIVQELAYSGGRDFQLADGSVVRSANITPDPASGIGAWTKEQFITRFTAYGDSNYKAPAVPPGGFNTVMPWTRYGKMKPEDLAAIYTYLKQLKPINNTVEKFSPAPGGAAAK